jgi:hypothetical protein
MKSNTPKITLIPVSESEFTKARAFQTVPYRDHQELAKKKEAILKSGAHYIKREDLSFSTVPSLAQLSPDSTIEFGAANPYLVKNLFMGQQLTIGYFTRVKVVEDVWSEGFYGPTGYTQIPGNLYHYNETLMWNCFPDVGGLFARWLSGQGIQLELADKYMHHPGVKLPSYVTMTWIQADTLMMWQLIGPNTSTVKPIKVERNIALHL